ncbi:MAG: hypothetical protein H6736_01840 [Alphaproteobacteria bacterium]|nr:hypothetical protein [Alphaproteobacteria bacterium]MCB9690533.1 hypothetical protein [Alphaproteobacteria bacterium]
MKYVLYALPVLLVALLGGAGWLFWVQNSQQEVLTSFELWGLGRYGRVWKVPVLIATSGGIGAVLGLVVGGWLMARLKNRRIRALTAASGGSESSW